MNLLKPAYRFLIKLSWLIVIIIFCLTGIPMKSDASVLSPGSPPLKSPKLYQPGRFIVKFKSDGPQALSESAASLLAERKSFQSAVVDRSDSLDQLNKRFKVQRALRIFLQKEGLNKLEALKAYREKIEAIKSNFQKRTRRIFQQQNIPDLTDVYVFEVPGESNIDEIIDAYQNDPHVEYAQPDYIMNVQMTPNDPFYISSKSWGQNYDDLWGLKKIQTSGAWDQGATGQGIVVAVLDTGLDYHHPDIASNVWQNPGEIASNGIDDDQNGFIDDVIGWDFANRDNNPMDGHGHGTHVSGTIAATGLNHLGIIGVAYNAKIMPVKGLTDGGSGSTSALALGIRYAADNGADVVNNSWGCSFSCPSNPVIEDAVRYAHSLGTVVVFAAGNSAMDVLYNSPQNMPDSKPVVVAAITPGDVRSSFSNFGGLLDVSAPGSGSSGEAGVVSPDRNILSLKSSLCNSSMCPTSLIVGENYVRQAGTSMAAPHVSGVLALLLSRYPDFSPDEALTVLRNTADDIAALGFDNQTGYGRVNSMKLTRNNISPCSAFITSPVFDSDISQQTTVVVKGQADCRDFSDYILEVSPQAAPNAWAVIKQSSIPIYPNAVLGSWDVSILQPGTYHLRLKVRNKQFQTYAAYSQLKFDIPPSPINNLTVQSISLSRVKLAWTATGDDGLLGNASSYDIRYSTSPILTDADFNAAIQEAGESLPKPPGSLESITIRGLIPNTTYYFAMKVVDKIKKASPLSNVVTAMTLNGKMLFSENFETGASEWSSNGLWHTSQKRAHHSATSAAYNNEVNYDTKSSNAGAIVSPVIDLTHASEMVLTFNSWFETEQNSSGVSRDKRQVQISIDNGVTWMSLTEWSSRNPNQLTFSSYGIDLTNFAGWKIRLRFNFDTVDALSNNFEGWYVDDVQIFTSIKNNPPVLNFIGSKTVSEGQLLEFTIQATDDSADNIKFVKPAAEILPRNSNVVIKAERPGYLEALFTWKPGVDQAGEYKIPVEVSDGQWTDSEIISIKVEESNLPPAAVAGDDQTVNAGESVSFSGAKSSDPNGDALTFNWNFGDGTSGSGSDVKHVYSKAGPYTATLTVSDGFFSSTDSVSVTVYEDIHKTFTDDFNRSDSTSIDNGWSEINGQFFISFNKLRTVIFQANHMAVLPKLNGAKQSIAANFAVGNILANPRAGVILRYQDSQNYYTAYRVVGLKDKKSELRISKVVHGTETVMARTSIANTEAGQFYRLGGSAKGSILALKLNDQTMLTVEDETFKSGAPGVIAKAGWGFQIWYIDDVSASVRTSGNN